ncbi:restriction endonuclease subunit S [uncultured Helicobacter sp.]|uniref:restriction endonuclease subunit S n=1 Tax=uncultured Helicobacter sp. TaxID=175537 RepID=UPI002639D15E|nr:restriction endonuclease subunit S [uncultured Helicobacter sp.]
MNTLNQTLQEKFPHLEVSVLKLSETQKDNETKRIDSEYFKKEYLEKIQTLLPISTKLQNLIVSGYYGILPKSDDYLDKGLSLVRGKDIRDSSLEISNLVKVPYAYFQERYCIHQNDILFLVKGATIGYSDGVLLILEEPIEPMIFNGSVFKMQAKNINSAYLYVFMMTNYFTFQKLREVANNGIEYNSLPTINNFLIPLLPMDFQLEIEKLVKDSHLALEQSKALYKEAEDLLYTELGLNPQNPMQSILQSHSNDINFRIATLKESFLKTGRLDSEYYQVKYEEIEKRIKTYTNGYCKLKDIVVSFSGGFAFSSNEYLENGDLALIRINNIKNANLDMNNAVYLNDEAISLSPKDKVKKGDILISMSGSIGLSCVVRENLHAMVNQRILKISIDDFNADVLVLLLNSVLCKLQFERIGTGGVQTNLATSDILNILIPKINPNTQDSIASHIQQSFTLRAEAKALLNEAKAKVESAIIGGGGNNASFVAFRIQIFRIYFPQIKTKLKEAKRHYRLAEWLLLEELLFSQTTTTGATINYTITTLKQSLGTSGRLDSEYYQSKYEKNEAVIKSKPYIKLGDIVTIKKSIEPGSEAYRESGIPFIRVSNLGTFGISQTEVFLDSKDFKKGELESLYPKKDMILLSKDGSVGIAYYVEKDLECVTSGAILHLTIKNQALVLPQYLNLVLNALPTKLQSQRDSGGSIIAHWKISEIENLLIPLLELSIQEKIESKITQSLALRTKSKELLEKAKAKVEEKISLL